MCCADLYNFDSEGSLRLFVPIGTVQLPMPGRRFRVRGRAFRIILVSALLPAKVLELLISTNLGHVARSNTVCLCPKHVNIALSPLRQFVLADHMPDMNTDVNAHLRAC